MSSTAPAAVREQLRGVDPSFPLEALPQAPPALQHSAAGRIEGSNRGPLVAAAYAGLSEVLAPAARRVSGKSLPQAANQAPCDQGAA